jgi:light-regulated signal transduction histidine kinase (bacteriophytochrome)
LGEFKQNDPKRKVVTEITPDIVVRCDTELIRVALTHLIANAWKFTVNRADAKIKLGWRKEGDNDVCYLRDNGVGFDMAYANKLFVPFQRLHSPDDFAGRGIGLAIVARIIHRHGGDIAAEASLGKGTTITFTLRSNRVTYHDQRSHIAR